MAKIKLGVTPKNFPRVVKFPLLDGTTGEIKVTFKYRTRTEFGKFIDGLVDAAGESSAPSDKFSMADLMEKTAGANADYILDVIEAWDVDAELTRENVQQLANEIPVAVATIMEDYRKAIIEGRLGN